MVDIFICEDDLQQRANLETLVKNYVLMEDLDMKLTLSTGNPQDILEYLKKNPKTVGLYFLDIDLQNEMTGIGLGKEIRNYDVSGKIIFITTHGELMSLTFTHLIEAMDYIVKGADFEDIKRKVTRCLDVVNQRYLEEKKSHIPTFFEVKTGSKKRLVPLDDIMFFTPSSPHKLTLHLKNGQIDFRDSMKEIADSNDTFVRIHTSYIVNLVNIKSIDRINRELEMNNGEKCLISTRGLKELDKALDRFKK